MAKKATYTNAVIDLFKRHESEAYPARKRRYNKNFPLWVGLRGVYCANGCRIDRLLNGHFMYPFSTYWEAKEEIAHRMVRNKPITTLQFNLIDGYLCDHGYYNGHRAVGALTPPASVMPIGRGHREWSAKTIVSDDVEEWFIDILRSMNHKITLRAILDPMLTDLILSQALEITAKQAKTVKKPASRPKRSLSGHTAKA